MVDLAKKFEEYGVEALIYTDIGRDGMMSGVNIDATFKLAQQLKTPIIASGGLSSVKDVRARVREARPEGSSASSPGARSTKARSTSRRRRPRRTRRSGRNSVPLAKRVIPCLDVNAGGS